MARTKFSELRDVVVAKPGATERLTALHVDTLEEIRLYKLRHGEATEPFGVNPKIIRGPRTTKLVVASLAVDDSQRSSSLPLPLVRSLNSATVVVKSGAAEG